MMSKKMLSAVDLALVSETREELKRKAGSLQRRIRSKDLRANVKKTKIVISNKKAEKVTMEGKLPCAV